MSILDASLILTVLNEERAIGEFLASIHEQTAIPSEILIVDGGSSDHTVETIRAWQAPIGVRIAVEVMPGATISQGRNRALKSARNEFVLVSDAGACLDARWAECLLAALESGADVASGFFEPAGTSDLQRTIGSTITPLRDEIDPDTFLPSSRSLAVRKSALDAIGGYPEWLDYCEDLVMDLNLKRAGYRFMFVPDAIVTWDSRPTMPAFAKQYYRYARGDSQANLWPKRHAARYAAYAFGLGSIIASRRAPWILAVTAVGGAVYLSKFFRRVWVRRSMLSDGPVRALILVPVIVVTGDLAKMTGYAAGFLVAAKRRRTLSHP